MTSQGRRAALFFGLSLSVPRMSPGAAPASSPASQADVKQQKRAVIQQANAQWKAQHDKEVAAAKAAEKRGEFSSLSPPQALVPFKDWDYYYTRGFSMWRPNTGQSFKPVAVPEGFVTDLASIPEKVWSFGIRPEGPYAYAAVIHDYLYWLQDRTREEADGIFLTAMADSKVEQSLRNRIYNAVRLAGDSAWKNNSKLKNQGERRVLKQFPEDFTITWKEWKARPGVFLD